MLDAREEILKTLHATPVVLQALVPDVSDPDCVTDEVAAARFLLDHDQIQGPVNLTAPHPVTNTEFTAALASTLGRPALLRLPDLGGGSDGWTLMLEPDPLHDPGWLDLTATPSEPVVRIDLTRPPDTAAVTVSAATASPASCPAASSLRWFSGRDRSNRLARARRATENGPSVSEPVRYRPVSQPPASGL